MDTIYTDGTHIVTFRHGFYLFAGGCAEWNDWDGFRFYHTVDGIEQEMARPDWWFLY